MNPPPSRRDFLGALAGISAGYAAFPSLRTVEMQDGEAAWHALQAEFGFGGTLVPMNAANMCPPPREVVAAVEAANRSVDADVSFHNRARFNTVPLNAGTTGNVRFVRFWMRGTQVPGGTASCPGPFSGCTFMDMSEIAVYGTPAP